MNAPVLADTSFWMSLLIQRDVRHARAVVWQSWLKSSSTPLITTEAVLWELLNGLAVPSLRAIAHQVYIGCHEDDRIDVVGFRQDLVKSALRLYASRQDKDWGLTDCFSFVVMDAKGIKAALTADRHFEQAGYQALLLREPPPAK